MPENAFEKIAKIFANKGNTDHIDMEEVDKIAQENGVDQLTGRKAFFSGRDYKALHESELLDGGDGSETARVSLKLLAKTTLSKGKQQNKI